MPLSPEHQLAYHYASQVLAERQMADPLIQFIPTQKQQAFIDAVLGDQCYENWFIASNRAGKSDAGAYCDATLLRYGIAPTRPAVGASTVVWDRAVSGWLVGPDYSTLRDVLLPKLFDNGYVALGQSHPPFIPPHEIERWHADEQVLRLKSGSLLRAKSNEQERVKFAAAGVDFIHFDEEPQRSHYLESTLRVEAGRRLRIFGTCTLLPPEHMVGGVSWMYHDLIEPWEAGRTTIGIYGAAIYDNPHLPADEIRRLEARYPVGSVERQIRLEGLYLPEIAGTRAYGSYDARLHLRPQGPPSRHLPLCWFWDFNVQPLCSGVGQRDRQGRFHVLREFVLATGHIAGMVEAFRRAYPTHDNEIWVYGDASGHARTAQTAESDYTLILALMRGYPSPVRLKVPEANPRQQARVHAVNMALYGPYGEVNVEIDPQCVELAADLRGVLLDGQGGIKKTTRRGDPYSQRTHISDGFGGWVVYEAPVQQRQSTRGPAVTIPAPAYSSGGRA